jgi:peptide-methionine (S)-S-oxide reductase
MSVEIKRLFYLKLKSLIQWKIKRDTRRTRNSNARRRLLLVHSSFLRIRSTCCYFWLYWGKTIDPTYKEICNGDRTCRSNWNHSILLKSDSEIFEIFCNTRSDYDKSPRNDVGTQYRSDILSQRESRKKDSRGLHWFNDRWRYLKRIVTKISPVSKFYEAEKVQQNYYNDNKSQGYCSYVITLK